MNALLVGLEILGALGVFLLGMKIMSEGLQKVAGAQLKNLLGLMTTNRFTGVLTGFGVTCVIQSSSATTVMVVSFVTASLLTLPQAIGVIMGANIGTTVTGWLVALLGFKVKITAFAMPAIGIGFLMSFVKGERYRQIGETLMGFGLLFMGLSLLKHSVPDIGGAEEMAWVASLTSRGFLSTLIFVFIGTALTVVLQSSSATMTLTLTLAALGLMPYHLAAAMVLGENIGTTATANLAAIGTPIDARRAARAHFVFNVFGVVWALTLMNLYLLPVVDMLVPGDPLVDFAALQGDEAAVASASTVVTTHLAAFHTLFNVTNTLLMLPFVNQLERLVTRWVPETEGDGRTPARYISAALVETPGLLIIQVRKELEYMTEIVQRMFTDSVHILTHPKKSLGALVEETLQREDDLDTIEREITTYLTRVAQAASSTQTAQSVAELTQNAHRLERMGDHCAVLVRIAARLHDDGVKLTKKERKDIMTLAELVDEALANLHDYQAGAGDVIRAERLERRIDRRRSELRTIAIERLQAGEEEIPTGLALLDVLTHLEEIGDRAIGIIRLTELTQSGRDTEDIAEAQLATFTDDLPPVRKLEPPKQVEAGAAAPADESSADEPPGDASTDDEPEVSEEAAR